MNNEPTYEQAASSEDDFNFLTLVELFDKVNDESRSSLSFPLSECLDHYHVDHHGSKSEESFVNTINGHTGQSYCYDATGLALHNMGPYLYKLWAENRDKLWAENRVLSSYESVKYLPIMQWGKPFYGDDRIKGLLQEEDIDSLDENTLVIIGGLDNKFRFVGDGNPAKNVLQRIIESRANYIAIGNAPACHLFQDPQHESYTIAQSKPFVHIDYTLSDGGEGVKFAMDSKCFADEVTEALTTEMFIDDADPKSVQALDLTHLEHYFRDGASELELKEERVKHDPRLLGAHDYLRLLCGRLDNIEDVLQPLSSPEQWYYAALSAEKVHALASSKPKYYVYLIGGHVIVRDMNNHYISDLGPRADITPEHKVSEHKASEQDESDFVSLLSDFVNQESFAGMEEARLYNALNEFKDQRDRLSKKGHRKFKKLCEVLNSSCCPNDDLVQQSLNKEAAIKKISYQALTTRLKSNPSSLTELESVLNDVIYGQVCGAFYEVPLLLAITMLAEGARRPSAILQTFAFIKMVAAEENPDNKREMWLSFVASPLMVDQQPDRLAKAMLLDGLDSIGGSHAMGHNHSYNQQQDLNGGRCPQWGAILPEIKEFFVYARWLNLDFRENVSDSYQINSCDVSLDKSAEFTALSYRVADVDRLHLYRDLNFKARFRSLCGGVREEAEKFNPYLWNGQHFLAHPANIEVIGSMENMCVAYRVTDPRSQHKDRATSVSLGDNGDLAVAEVLSACGRESEALFILKILIRKHPLNLDYRFSRAQLVINLKGDERNIISDESNLVEFVLNDLVLVIEHSDSLELVEQAKYLKGVAIFRKATALLEDHQDIDLVGNTCAEALTLVNAYLESDYCLEHIKPLASNKKAQIYFCLSNVAGVDAQRNSESCKKQLAFQFEAMSILSRNLVTCGYAQIGVQVSGLLGSSDLRVRFLLNALTVIQGEHEHHCTRVQPNGLNNNLKKLKVAIETMCTNFSCNHAGNRETISRLVRTKYDELMLEENAPGGDIARMIVGLSRYELAHPGLAISPWRVNERQQKLLQDQGGIYSTQIDGAECWLIKINYKVPFHFMRAWFQCSRVKAAVVYEKALGYCFLIKHLSDINPQNFKPLPHPELYEDVSYEGAIDDSSDEIFNNFCNEFKVLKQDIAAWRPSDSSMMNHAIVNAVMQLPQLERWQRSNGQVDIIFPVLKGIPASIAENWLQRKVIQYRYISIAGREGRFVCIDQVALRLESKQNPSRCEANQPNGHSRASSTPSVRSSMRSDEPDRKPTPEEKAKMDREEARDTPRLSAAAPALHARLTRSKKQKKKGFGFKKGFLLG